MRVLHSMVYDEGLFGARTLSATRLKTHPRYYVGVDLGRAQDHSAVAVVERAEVLNPRRDPITWSFHFDARFHVRHAETLDPGSPYPQVAERVKALMRHQPLRRSHLQVIVDATAAGAPVVDLMRRAGLACQVIPVVITGGDREASDEAGYRVARKDLVSGLQLALQQRRLAASTGMRRVTELVAELRSMQVVMSEEEFERFAGRKQADPVLALSLAWWRANLGTDVV